MTGTPRYSSPPAAVERPRRGIALQAVVALVLLAPSADPVPVAAQTAGLPCGNCPSNLFTLKLCTIQETVQEGTACNWFRTPLKNCQTPELTDAGVEVIQSGSNVYRARLLLEAKAPWNSDPDSDSATRLQLHWSRGDEAPIPGEDGCLMSAIDHGYNALQVEGLSCDGAPYDFGTYSVAGIVCEGRTGCERTATVTGMRFVVSKAMLGCPDPPKQMCNGDASCVVCEPGGIGLWGGGPGIGGLGGIGNPAPGGGAHLYYAAGGAGHPQYPGTSSWNTTLGRYWSHDYARRIVLDPDESHVWLITRYATFREWSAPDGTTGVYATVSPSNEYRTLTWLGTGAGWELRELDGTVHLFDSAGLWLSTTDRNGNAKTATYSGGVLVSVAFPDGRREDFVYHPSGKLASITEVGVDGISTRVWEYGWAGDDLTRVDRPDGTAILYGYGEARHPGYLTEIAVEGTDGSSIRVERAYEYDDEGNVTATWRGDSSKSGPDATELWRYSYDDPVEPTVTTVTDPLGSESVYQLERDTVSSNVKVTSISGDCPVCGLGPNVQIAYGDASHPLLPTEQTDGRGLTTAMSYDSHGMMTSRTEAMGEPEERTTTWQYDSMYPALVTEMEVPSVIGGGSFRTTEWLRDGSGNPTTRRITGVEAGSAFQQDTVTSFNAAGQPLVVDPPGYDQAGDTPDTVTFDYTPTAGEADRGGLFPFSRIVHLSPPLTATTLFGYDAFNRRVSVSDPNDLETVTSYDELDRVAEVRQVDAAGDLVTLHEYTPLGDLERTTLPNGHVIEYAYDAAGRLLSIVRGESPASPGERVLYTLDEAGNRVREELQRWDGSLGAWGETESETRFDYSSRCHLDRVVRAPGTPEEAVTEYAYDCNGNLERVWDANHPRFPEDPEEPDPPVDTDPASLVLQAHEEAPATTVYTYDGLDRLGAVTQLWGGDGGGSITTTYGYDVQDHLVSVTDAEGNRTTYDYSDRDLLTGEVSPVSGTTTHVYNEHGELIETTDARGVTVTRTVDQLDRVTELSYPDPALDTSYLYDQAPIECSEDRHAGRLAEILRGATSVPTCYDRFGRVTRDGELTYGHDANGNRTTIGYPDGVVATYGYDFAERQETLTLQVGADPAETLVSSAGYLPSGPLASLSLGNGLTEARSFDGRYAPAAIDLAGVTTLVYATDPVGNVLGIERTVDGSAWDLFYAYQDVQYFLTVGAGPWGTLLWSYDGIGNRLTHGEPSGSDADAGFEETTYTYVQNASGGNTPRLDRVKPTSDLDQVSYEYAYDAAGNLTSIEPMPSGPGSGASLLSYDAASRVAGLSTAFGSEDTAVLYDGRGYLGRAELTDFGSSDFARTEAVYGSEGRLYVVRREAEETVGGGGDGDAGLGVAVEATDATTLLVYFAGRPVAQLTIDHLGVEPDRLLFLTTDHLGTPVTATDAAGTAVWQGGLSPFGTPYSFIDGGVTIGDGDPGGPGGGADDGSDVDDPDQTPVDPPPDPEPCDGVECDDGRDGTGGGGGGGEDCVGAECDDGRDGGGGGGGGEPCQGIGCDDDGRDPPDDGDGRDDGGGSGSGGDGCTGAGCDDGRDDGGGGGGGGSDPCEGPDCDDGRSAVFAGLSSAAQGLAGSPREAGILLRFPGQWDDPTFRAANVRGGIYYNVHRWYSPATGRYSRPDPWGIDRPSGLAHLYAYAEGRPLALVDPEGLLPFDPFLQPLKDGLDCFYCLLARSNFGIDCSEQGAWVTFEIRDGGLRAGCEIWPPTAERGRTTFRGQRPPGLIGQAHTHPTRCRIRPSEPRPSANDRDTARRFQFPVFTISPDGIWRYDPGTDDLTRVAPNNWYRGPQDRNCEPCEGIPQP